MIRIVTAALIVLAGCGVPPATVTPAPQAHGPAAADEASHAGHPPSTAVASPAVADADVDFMRHMLAHHAQALVMTALVDERTGRQDIRLLARRIDMAQQEEMDIMRRWLSERGRPVPGSQGQQHDHHHHADDEDHSGMPGMLTEAQLERLAAARGAEFDRLFLEAMIYHHEGALVMVAELFEAGGGQDPEIFQFASHVDSDQRIEIERMYRMLVTSSR